jgi:hypothetical protein
MNGRLSSVFSHLRGNPVFRFACAGLAAEAKLALAEEAAAANEDPRFCVTRFRWFCPVPRYLMELQTTEKTTISQGVSFVCSGKLQNPSNRLQQFNLSTRQAQLNGAKGSGTFTRPT